MAAANPNMKMPELLVFARLFAIGFLGAEVWRIAFILGSNFAPMISDLARRRLQWCDDPTYWTNVAFDQRHITIMVEGLKEEGVPQWVIDALMGLRRAIGAIRSRLLRTPSL